MMMWSSVLNIWNSIKQSEICFPSQDIWLDERKFKIIKQLGEGGYSFIYLVKEFPTKERPFVSERNYALKKILAGNSEQLKLAEKEIDVLSKIKHPNIIKLLKTSVFENSRDGNYTIYMLLPWFKEGNVYDLVSHLKKSGFQLSSYIILDIFKQTCEAIYHLHCSGYTHRDIKPHNILLNEKNQIENETEITHTTTNNNNNSTKKNNEIAYEAVIADFGSIGNKTTKINTRREAISLQEEAEALASMPYRAPELYDVHFPSIIDERIDTWSLGCTLYFMMYGISPFESALGERGGSLSLAVINGRYTWPRNHLKHYPKEIHEIVEMCLQVDVNMRPKIDKILEHVNTLLEKDIINNVND